MILDSQKDSDFFFSKWKIRVAILDSNLSIILSWFVSLLILRTNVFFLTSSIIDTFPKLSNTWNSKTIDNQWWFSHPQENEKGKEKIHYTIKDILYVISTTSIRKIKWKRAHWTLCFTLMSSLVKLKKSLKIRREALVSTIPIYHP